MKGGRGRERNDKRQILYFSRVMDKQTSVLFLFCFVFLHSALDQVGLNYIIHTHAILTFNIVKQ